MSVGERIRYQRKLHHLTQKELADESGVARVSIIKYETHKMKPTVKALSKIAKALNVSIYKLLDDDQKEKCPPSDISMSEANINKPISIVSHQGGKINDFL